MRMIELYHVSVHGEGFDVWHNGRMVEKWADKEVIKKTYACFALYDEADIARALRCTAELFGELAKGCAEKGGYTYTHRVEYYAKEVCEALLG